MSSRFFSEEELRCKGAEHSPGDHARPSDELLAKLDTLRGVYGAPLYLTSAIRCPLHNEQVGGTRDSAHIEGLAADIAVSGSRQRHDLLRLIMKLQLFRRVGIAKTFIHVDVSPSADQDVVWLYS